MKTRSKYTIGLKQPAKNNPNKNPVLTVAMKTEANANADFIIRACNAHDDLVEACKAALQCQLDVMDENTIDLLESALAKAQA